MYEFASHLMNDNTLTFKENFPSRQMPQKIGGDKCTDRDILIYQSILQKAPNSAYSATLLDVTEKSKDCPENYIETWKKSHYANIDSFMKDSVMMTIGIHPNQFTNFLVKSVDNALDEEMLTFLSKSKFVFVNGPNDSEDFKNINQVLDAYEFLGKSLRLNQHTPTFVFGVYGDLQNSRIAKTIEEKFTVHINKIDKIDFEVMVDELNQNKDVVRNNFIKRNDTEYNVNVFINSGIYNGRRDESDSIVWEFGKNKIMKILITKVINDDTSDVCINCDTDPNVFSISSSGLRYSKDFEIWLNSLIMHCFDEEFQQEISNMNVIGIENQWTNNSLMTDYLMYRCRKKPALHEGISVFALNHPSTIEILEELDEVFHENQITIEVNNQEVIFTTNDVIILGEENIFEYACIIVNVVRSGESTKLKCQNISKLFPRIHLDVGDGIMEIPQELDHKLINLEMKQEVCYFVWYQSNLLVKTKSGYDPTHYFSN